MRARLALALSLPLLATAARAQPANGAPAQAVVAGPLPGDLRARVEGQTGDLAWRLRFEPAAPRPAGLDAAARAFPEARVVVWVRGGESEALRLSLVDLRDRRLLEREVAPPEGEAFAASTLHETAALLIRGALQALSLGGEVGVAVPAPAPPPEAQRPPAVPAPPPPPPPTSPWLLEAELGWLAALDGESPAAHGPHAGLALRWKRLRVGLEVATGIAATLSDAFTRVELRRDALALSLGVALLRGERGGLDLGLRLGAAHWQRGAVELRAPSATSAAPARHHWSALVGAALRLTWTPHPLVGLRLALGADLVPAAPELVYEAPEGERRRNALWLAQPFLGLALVVRTAPNTERNSATRELAHAPRAIFREAP